MRLAARREQVVERRDSQRILAKDQIVAQRPQILTAHRPRDHHVLEAWDLAEDFQWNRTWACPAREDTSIQQAEPTDIRRHAPTRFWIGGMAHAVIAILPARTPTPFGIDIPIDQPPEGNKDLVVLVQLLLQFFGDVSAGGISLQNGG
jgi:hypothetical protein